MSWNLSSIDVANITTAQGPIIQVWPSGQITLTGDVIGSRGGTMWYEATMVFRDLTIKLLWSYRHKTEENPHFMDFMPEF